VREESFASLIVHERQTGKRVKQQEDREAVKLLDGISVFFNIHYIALYVAKLKKLITTHRVTACVLRGVGGTQQAPQRIYIERSRASGLHIAS
jgi:hypothetical protein